MFNLEQTRQDACLYCWKLLRTAGQSVSCLRTAAKIWSDTDIIAMVELDMRKRRVRVVCAREPITECLRELEHSRDSRGRGTSRTHRDSAQESGSRLLSAQTDCLRAIFNRRNSGGANWMTPDQNKLRAVKF